MSWKDKFKRVKETTTLTPEQMEEWRNRTSGEVKQMKLPEKFFPKPYDRKKDTSKSD